MELSRIKKVELREIWKHEATNFTRWLAKQENLSLLSQEAIEAKKVEDENNRILKLARLEEDKKQTIIDNKRIEAEKLAKVEADRIAAEEAKKPKMFEGSLKAGSTIIDAEVESVVGYKAKLKRYAPNQSGNFR